MTQSSETAAQKAWHDIEEAMSTFETMKNLFRPKQSSFCSLPSGRPMTQAAVIKRFEKIERAAIRARKALEAELHEGNDK